MLLWFVSLSVLGTFAVFRDPAIDYRLIAAGSILPDAVDAVLRRGVGPLHSVVVAVAVLTVVMVASIRRRRLRRRLLALSIGIFAHLVLDGAWTSTRAFWWPLAGPVASAPVPSFARSAPVTVLMELIGAAAAVIAVRRFGLDRASTRSRFLRSGRLDAGVA